MGKNRAIFSVVFFLFAGCGGSGEQDGNRDMSSGTDDQGASPEDLAPPSLALACRSDNGVVADLTVPVGSATSIRIDYGDETMAFSTPNFTVVPGSFVTVPLFGMLPGQRNYARVTYEEANGTMTQSKSVSADCAALPTGMPAITVTTPATGSGFYLLDILFGQNGANMIIDRQGRVYYYSSNVTPSAFEQTPSGLVMYEPTDHEFREFSLTGKLLRHYTDGESANGADSHEFRRMPDGHVFILGSNYRPLDASGIVDGGSPTAQIIENTVVEFDETGRIVFRWLGGDHLSLTEANPEINLKIGLIDSQHANSIDRLRDGNLLVSMRNTSTVYKIEHSSGKVLWRLGGNRSDFEFVNDPLNGIQTQHFARELADGSILLFDNGGPRIEGSRVAQYALDEQTHKATLVWSHFRPFAVHSYCCGSTTRLANGNTLTAWGTEGLIDEVTPDEKTVWEVEVAHRMAGAVVYRIIPISSLYPSGL